MEVNVFKSEYSKELETLIVKEAEFAGFCAISVRPCFEGSKIAGVNSYSNNDLALDFSLLREEINKLLDKEKTQNKEVYELNDKTIEITENVSDINDNVEKVVEEVIEDFNKEENIENNIIETTENVNMEDNKDPEPEPIVEPEPTNYEESYNELQTKFNELVAKCSDLETEIVPLRQFKAEVETKENQAKAEMELKEKNDLIESFATKLPKKSIEDIIDDVTKFTLDEIKMKLSIALADQILANKKDDNAEFSDITINIDNMNKSVSREERLIAEIKSKKRK